MKKIDNKTKRIEKSLKFYAHERYLNNELMSNNLKIKFKCI